MLGDHAHTPYVYIPLILISLDSQKHHKTCHESIVNKYLSLDNITESHARSELVMTRKFNVLLFSVYREFVVISFCVRLHITNQTSQC